MSSSEIDLDRDDPVFHHTLFGIRTPITHDSIRLGHRGFAVWRACHAVLNENKNMGLNTSEIEEKIHSHYSDKEFTRNTLSHILSQSEDFFQPSRKVKDAAKWFLTGTTKGVEKSGARRARKAAEAAGMVSGDGDDDDLEYGLEITPILELPYPINAEHINARHSGPSTFPLPTYLQPPQTDMKATIGLAPSFTRRKTRPKSIARVTGGYHPYAQSSRATIQHPENIEDHFKFNYDSQLNSVPPLEITSTISSQLCSSQKFNPMSDGLQGLPTPPSENILPQNPPPVVNTYPNPLVAPMPPQTNLPPWLHYSPYLATANQFGLGVSYSGNLGVDTVDPKDVQAPLWGEQHHPLQDDLISEEAAWGTSEKSHGKEDLYTLPCGTTIPRAIFPTACQMMNLGACSAGTAPTGPQDWFPFQTSVVQNPTTFTAPTCPIPNGQSEPLLEPDTLAVGSDWDITFL